MTEPAQVDCQGCDVSKHLRSIPVELRSILPGGPPTIAICPACLRIDPVRDPEVPSADESPITDALPFDSADAVAVVVLVHLLSSLAMNRSAIELLVEHLERRGVDPLLALDRLARDQSLDLAVDLERRRGQLVQLLS